VRLSLLTSLPVIGLALSLTQAAEPAAAPDYYRDVFPFLKANCISCHNKTTDKAGLNMETPDTMKQGGDSGPALVAGDAAASLIVQASLHENDLEMPPANNKSGAVNLTPAEIQILREWVNRGAKASVQEARQVAWQPLAAGVHPVYSVALTQSGRYAACARSNEISLYDLGTRRPMGRISEDKSGNTPAHRALVQSLAFSPDGSRLASGSFREVKIWRQQKPALPALSQADTDSGTVISNLAAQGGVSVTGSASGRLMVQETETGRILKTIAEVAPGGFRILAVSPDGARAAVYRADSALSVWDLSTGARLVSQQEMPGLTALSWTSDGATLISASGDQTLHVRTVPSSGNAAPEFARPKVLLGSLGAVTALAPCPNPDHFLAASAEGKVRLWSVIEGKVVRELSVPGATCLSVSPDGRRFAAGGADGQVAVLDLASGKSVATLRGSSVALDEIARLEWTVAARQLDQTFHKAASTRIEAQNKALDELLKKAHDAIAIMQKLLPEREKGLVPLVEAKAAAEKAVAEAAAALGGEAGAPKQDPALEKKLKDAQDKLGIAATAESAARAALMATLSNVADSENEVKRITVSKEANAADLAAAQAATETAKADQTRATTELTALRKSLATLGGKPLAVAFSEDGETLAAALADGTLQVWAVSSGAPLEHVKGPAASSVSLSFSSRHGFVAAHPNGTLLSAGAPPRWELERTLGAAAAPALFADRINAVRFSPDGKLLAIGGGELSRSGDVHIFDLASGSLVQSWAELHSDAVLALDFSPDGRWLATGGSDKIARLTEMATGRKGLTFEGHTHYVMGVAFRADGRVLATAGADGVVFSWDAHSAERKKKIEGWTKEVTSLQFIGATNHIVTSAGDNLVRIVSDEGGQIRSIANLPDFMQSAASTPTPTGAILIGGGEDSLLRVWDGSNGKEVAVFGKD
jgi:WD40 repeat protein